MNRTSFAPRVWLVRAAVVALAALLGRYGAPVAPQTHVIEVPAPRPAPELDEFAPRAQGWLYDPDAVRAHHAAHAVPAFADTPAGRAALAHTGDVYLWDAARKVTGAVLPARDQGRVGSCVGFGTASAVEHLICVQIASGRGGRYRDLAPEVIYAGSRVEVGRGRLTGDGSVGAWAVEWVSKWGVVPRGAHVGGKFDLTTYDEVRCRAWGRTGVPDELEALAKDSPVKGYALVLSYEDADRAIRQGYPVVVCSGQGFAMRRDSDGFCLPSGVWYHCGAFIGTRAGPRRGLFFLNSWGDRAHPGPRVPADAPAAGFWVDAAVADEMLRRWRDSYALSDAVGFPERPDAPDWFVRARPAPDLVDPFTLLRKERVSWSHFTSPR
jgi:hypothetical protein